MLNPLVTIITPTYNRADLLPETVESVLRQDYENIEYIVIDDGSKDETKEVLGPYIGRLQYHYHDNAGETATVNKGLSLAKGDIVCVINSDDPFFVDHAVTTAVQVLKENPNALMAYPDWVSIDKDGNVLHEEKLPQYTLENLIEGARACLGPGMFIRKSAIEKVGPRCANAKYIGDLDYSFRMAALGEIVHIPYTLATHRVHSNSLSSLAKGRRMASEVASLGENYIDHPSLPERIRKNKNKIMAKWYFVSMSFTGSDLVGRLRYYMKAIKSSPVTTARMTILLILRCLKKPFIKN